MVVGDSEKDLKESHFDQQRKNEDLKDPLFRLDIINAKPSASIFIAAGFQELRVGESQEQGNCELTIRNPFHFPEYEEGEVAQI